MQCLLCNKKSLFLYKELCPNCLFLSEERHVFSQIIDTLVEDYPEVIGLSTSLQNSLVFVALPYTDTYKIKFHDELQSFIAKALNEELTLENVEINV